MEKNETFHKVRVFEIVDDGNNFVKIIVSGMEFGGKEGFQNFKMDKYNKRLGIHEGSVLEVRENDKGEICNVRVTIHIPIETEKEVDPDASFDDID